MILGIISDTHNKVETIEKGLQLFTHHGVEQIIHCGDWTTVATMNLFMELANKQKLPVKGVLGNRDTEIIDTIKNSPGFVLPVDVAEQVILKLGGKIIAVYHGHHKRTLRNLIVSQQYDVVCTGHTHKPKVQIFGRTLVINPGSVAFTIPRSKNPVLCVALYDTTDNQATLLPIF